MIQMPTETTAIPRIPRLRAFFNSFRFVSVPLEVLDEYIDRYGSTIHTYIGGVYKSLLTTDPEVIRHVLQKNHRNYRKSPIQFEKMAHYLGNGLLTSDGDYWLRQRRLIQPGFHRRRLERLTGLMLGVIDEAVERLAHDMRRQGAVEIYPHMMETAFRIMARSLFSANLPEAELNLLSNNVTQLQEFMIREIRRPWMQPWLRISGQVGRHEAIAASSDTLILNYIRQRRQSTETHDDLLQMLLDARYEDTGQGMTERQLLDESTILLVAGHETSACALTWTCYLLGRYPEVAKRLQLELDEVLGDRRPTFADLPRLVYTMQVIEESMRLYPPAWITDRIALKDDEVAGVRIPAGTTIIIYIYGAHHAPAHWSDPDTFDPDRFSPSQKKEQVPFSFLPFGGGPRLCIGNHFALMEMQLVLAQLLRRYDLSLLPGQQITPRPLITMRPNEAVRMHLMKRK